jgi:hypothetical protein
MTVIYQVRILKSAAGELARVDKSAGARVAQRIKWLAEKVDSV